MFVALAKADAAQRLVYGSIDETPDRSGEVFDYATGKPAFEAWSAEIAKASGGKSLGNVRAQHDLKKAAGKLTALDFDDAARRVSFIAHIVDDAEWQKVEAGVYTGFSPGGRYAKRWKDGAHTRYTPVVGELSIVDIPCIPSAGFTLTKADGSEETISFVLDKAYEPGNDATKTRADDLAKAAGASAKAKDFVVQARADLIAENAVAALAKVDTPAPAIDTSLIDKVLAKADAAIAAANAPVPDMTLPEPFRDFAKAATAMRLIGGDDTLAKGMYQVRSAADLLQQLSYLQSEAAYETKNENDGSTVPAAIADVVRRMGAIVVQIAQEEVAELINAMPDAPVMVDGTSDDMALASAIVDMVKADTALMEKTGARNSKTDAATIQSMHDNAVKLGATCEAASEKAVALAADNDRLTKAFDAAVPRIEGLVATVERLSIDRAADRTAADERMAKMAGELEMLKAQPMPGKGQVFTLTKADDGHQGPAAAKGDPIDAMPNGLEKANAILRRVGNLPH